MKVLYIGVYRDMTGWGQAARDYILSLDAVGIDVVPRAIKLDNSKPEISERIKELEQKNSAGCDIVIQHLLPDMMQYHGGFKKNIALYFTETTNFKASNWAESINCLDEAWVANSQSKQASLNSDINVPIKIIPCATNIERFQHSYQHNSLRDKFPDDFIFYFIGERTRRKNMGALIKAFAIEFDPDEPVQLVIKTTLQGQDKGGVSNALREFCNETKVGTRMYPDPKYYKPEIIIAEDYSDAEVMGLHKSGDCLVIPSHGEAWNLVSMDSMGMGKTPIYTNWGGHLDYLNNNVGYPVDYMLDTIFASQYPVFDLYTPKEEWAYINIKGLCTAMRQAYENTQIRKEKSVAGMERVYDFTYEKVGQIMQETLS
jgi:glycosyltransferase involved in cell wall biosynthesis